MCQRCDLPYSLAMTRILWRQRRWWWALGLACSLGLVCGVMSHYWRREGSSLAPPEEAGRLVVAIRNSSTTFYTDSDNNFAGIEYELTREFARHLGVNAEYVVVADAMEANEKLARGEVHLAALGMPLADNLAGEAGPEFMSVRQAVVYNTEHAAPGNIADLQRKQIYVLAGSAQEQTLVRLHRQYPQLEWHAVTGSDMEDLLSYISLGQADYVIASSTDVDVARHYFPNLSTAFFLTPDLHLAWRLAPHSGERLQARLHLFFEQMQADGTLKRLMDRYFGDTTSLAQPDIAGILQRRLKLLPPLKPYFQQAESATGIDWRWLAAIGYQESHWDPAATSPAGARGLMMMTDDTARRMGVVDVGDSEESVVGGSEYLRQLHDDLDANIGEPDRMWMAIAAYNMGPAHLDDVRLLARRLGRDPDSWVDIKATLPLLQNPRYYRSLPYGYAHGGETVAYTESVRTYYDILVRFEDPYIPLFPASDAQVSIENPGHRPLELDGQLTSDGQHTLPKPQPIYVGPPYELAHSNERALAD